jgi:hypothetical protein
MDTPSHPDHLDVPSVHPYQVDYISLPLQFRSEKRRSSLLGQTLLTQQLGSENYIFDENRGSFVSVQSVPVSDLARSHPSTPMQNFRY